MAPQKQSTYFAQSTGGIVPVTVSFQIQSKKKTIGEVMDGKTSGKSPSKSKEMPKQLAESVVKVFPHRKVKDL